MKTYLRQSTAALRVLIVLTVLCGLAYPFATLAVAQLPGLRDKADGSLVHRGGAVVGSRLLGQSFTDAKGNPLRQYFQPRPSAAGDGYDPTSSGASNLGPESVEDAPDTPSLLTRVCARSHSVGRLEGVSGARPFCTSTGVGAVLRVFGPSGSATGGPRYAVSSNQVCPAVPFVRTWHGVPVRCHAKHADLSRGRLVVVRGTAPRTPAVPADAVTASGSGLDPDISPAYAALQVPRVAAARGLSRSDVRRLVAECTDGRFAGFVGEPHVNVLELNLALDRERAGR